MCVQRATVTKMLSFLKDEEVTENQTTDAMELFEKIRNDKTIDDLLPGTAENKLTLTIEKLQEKISHYGSQLRFEESDHSSILHNLNIIIETSIRLYCSTIFDPSLHLQNNVDYKKAAQIIKPDFFLLHGLTSSLSLLSIVPHLDSKQALKVIRSHFAILVFLFISRGRPYINLDAINNYPIPQEIQGWENILKLSTDSTDSHVSKVIRSLILGNHFLNRKEIPTSGLINLNDLGNNFDSLVYRAAVMTVDWMCIKGKKWEFDGCGFKETWQ